ncbi:ABC transporter permease [Rubellimicrobium arenae]|uniref:ABC transporter permease n=1 Tax=Rubellimicrobium arenae TaxID=2817372 RepID=UPI001B307875|nr:ABC transporter permease [Rubellimicrobium arenae]
MTDFGQALGPAQARRRTDPRHVLTRYGFFVLLAVVFVTFALLRPAFASEANLNEMMRSAAIAGLMFLGLTWIIAAGEIDVSFMSVAALANMIVAVLVRDGAGWGTASLAGLGAGLLFGALNALLVGVMRLPALVITIATGALAASIAAALGLGTSISLSQTGFVGRILAANLGVVPLVALVVLAIYALAWWAQERLTFGHYIYALEQNRAAVVEAGVPVNRILVLLYLLSGSLSALAGILLAAALSSGQPYLGNSYFLDGLTAVLLGGMALKLGKPNVIGTLAGIFLLIGLLNGAALLGWTDSQRQIVRGSLLLVGVSLVVLSRRRNRT